MSSNTRSIISSGSPSRREWYESSYRLRFLSRLLAFSYSALLTDGSVTLSSFPCKINNGNDTCVIISSVVDLSNKHSFHELLMIINTWMLMISAVQTMEFRWFRPSKKGINKINLKQFAFNLIDRQRKESEDFASSKMIVTVA